ncbi:MAG: PEP-CTERM sorting domain-containing protein [Acetobacteraceae bacterium]
MRSLLRKSAAVGLPVVALSLGLAGSAQAEYLPNVSNLNFADYTGIAPKGEFSSVDPVGWTGGTGLIFIDGPSASGQGASGSTYLQTYGPFPDPPIPGNYVEADGNPEFESGFNQSISGLTVGQTYTLSFYQAAGQQTTFTGDTTNQWIVALGTSGFTVTSSGGQGTYSSSDPDASIVETPVMNVASGSYHPWEYVSISLVADATTDLLSFLAWGDGGSTANEPPIAFLSGVNSPDVLVPVPEPAALSVLGVGLLGFGGVMLRRRARRGSVA